MNNMQLIITTLDSINHWLEMYNMNRYEQKQLNLKKAQYVCMQEY